MSRRTAILPAICAAALPAAALFFAACGPSGKFVTYKTLLLVEADSLLTNGYYGEAEKKYQKIRSSTRNTEETKASHFALAFINVYYRNPDADWGEALREFKSFVTLYPNDPRIGEALSWVRILTVIKSFDAEFHNASNQVERMKADKTETRLYQRILLDSMMKNCYEIRDSLSRKNAELENLILELEKKCQQTIK